MVKIIFPNSAGIKWMETRSIYMSFFG